MSTYLLTEVNDYPSTLEVIYKHFESPAIVVVGILDQNYPYKQLPKFVTVWISIDSIHWHIINIVVDICM